MIDEKDRTRTRADDNASTLRTLSLIPLTVGVVATLALCLELISLGTGLTDKISVVLLILGPVLLVVSVLVVARTGLSTWAEPRRWTVMAWTSGAVGAAAWLPDALSPGSLGRLQWALIVAGGVGLVTALSLRSIDSPAMDGRGGRATQLVKAGMIALLALSFVVTALTSSVLRTPLGGPDESAHYSYVRHMAENPLEFPPRFEDQRSGDGELNHLVHPPLYYQLMAVPYWILDVERQLTSVGLDADPYGGLSGPEVIPPLRAASLSLVLVHLVGLYLLLAYLVRRSVLPGWGAVLAAAALGLVPGFTFIAGTLNNDVLALAIWPFLVLAAVRYFFDNDRKNVYIALLLAALGALTKATLWPLILLFGAGILGIQIARALRPADGATTGGRLSIASRLWRGVRPLSTSEWAWFVVAAGFAAVAVFYFSSMYVRYGAFQPSYTTVYGLAPEDSQFRNIPEGGIVERSPLEFSMSATKLLFRSLFGILGQTERIYDPNPEHFAHLIIALTAVGVVLAIYGLAKRRGSEFRRSRVWLASAFMATSLVFMAVFLLRSFARYHEHGYYGVQGRYLIGYIDLWLIGLIALAWLTFRGTRTGWSRTIAGLVTAAIAVAIVWAFVDPFFYLHRTQELADRIEIDRLVPEEANSRGMNEEVMRPVAPQEFIDEGSDPPLSMSWSEARVEDTVALGTSGCLEVWLYGDGTDAGGEAPVLEIGLKESGGDEYSVLDRVEVPAGIDVAQLIVAHDASAPEGELSITHTNLEAHQSPLLEWFTPRSRPYVLLGAYTRAAECG